MGILALLSIISLIHLLIALILRITKLKNKINPKVLFTFELIYLDLSIIYIIASFIIGNLPPKIQEVAVELEKFPIENYRIVQISDLHIGPLLRKDFLKKCIEQINSVSPHLVVITGDLIDQPAEKISDILALLSTIRSQNGVYFVLGNHEYYNGAEMLIEKLKRFNVKPLINQNVKLSHKGKSFYLAGISDQSGYRFNKLIPDLLKTLSGIEDNSSTILLSHRPSVIYNNLEKISNKVDLILSGHTHGGQILPFNLFVRMREPYISGLHSLKNLKIYVNTGTGFWGPPIRFFERGEITLLNINPQKKIDTIIKTERH